MENKLFRGKVDMEADLLNEDICEYKKGDWVYGSLITGYEMPIIIRITKTAEGTYNRQAYWVDPDTVCQYIGRDDKNGKKIFSRDIAECSTCYGKKVKGAIYYDENYSVYCIGDYDFSKFDNIEVIGNIYDNPELEEE